MRTLSAILSFNVLFHRRIKDAVRNADGTPPFYRLADMPHFEVGQIRFTIGPCHCQETKLADGIECAVVVATMCVLLGSLKLYRHIVLPPAVSNADPRSVCWS
jgi:hypothetical protein